MDHQDLEVVAAAAPKKEGPLFQLITQSFKDGDLKKLLEEFRIMLDNPTPSAKEDLKKDGMKTNENLINYVLILADHDFEGIQNYKLDLINLLVENNAKIGKSVFCEVIKIASELEPTLKSKNPYENPVQYAKIKNIFNYLLDKLPADYNINLPQHKSYNEATITTTPLFYATFNIQEDDYFLKQLLEKGANPTSKNILCSERSSELKNLIEVVEMVNVKHKEAINPNFIKIINETAEYFEKAEKDAAKAEREATKEAVKLERKAAAKSKTVKDQWPSKSPKKKKATEKTPLLLEQNEENEASYALSKPKAQKQSR